MRRTPRWLVLAAVLFPVVGLPLLAVMLAFPATPAFADDALPGNGKTSTEARALDGFQAVQAAGSIDVQVEEGRPFRVEVTADENLLPELETRVEEGTLRIGFRRPVHPRGPVRVSVALPELRGAGVAGSGSLRVTGKQDRARDVELAIAGSGGLAWKGDARTLKVSIGGSGNVDVAGTAAALAVEVGGSGSVSARELRAKEARVQVAGSGNVKLTVDGGPLTVQSAGSGNVEWWGTASDARVARVGSGAVTARR